MKNIAVRLMRSTDFEGAHNVDILTQKQYLDTGWDMMGEDEQERHLTSKKPEFYSYIKIGYSFVAKIDNEIVGILLMSKHSCFSKRLFVDYIAINPTYQRKGIGLLLYKALINKAKKDKIEEIKALINLDNPNSIKLHEKTGFQLKDRKEAVLNMVS